MNLLKKNNQALEVLYLFVLFFISLSIVSINLGFNIRIGQLFILLMFGITLLIDFKEKKVNETLLVFFLFFAFLLTIISKNSEYSKIGEIKFVIKYLLIFPATFYLGHWVVRNFEIRNFLKTMEITLGIYIFMGFLLYFYPIAAIYNDRGELSGFQGTFLETGWYALVIGAFTLTSILVRLDYKLGFSKPQYLLYFISLISLVLSKNKTVWIGVIAIIFIIAIFKSIIVNKKNIKSSVQRLKDINSFYFFMLCFVFILIFFIVNTFLPEPIVSVAMLEEKLNEERGKAFLATIRLLENSDWLGAYGFGFVQQYFSIYTDEIIGLDENSGMIFNSYLDIWISAGIMGVLYHFLLLHFSFSRIQLFTLIIPIYWFISANTNPTTGDEYYYLFLGISYGFIIKNKEGLIKK